LSKIKKRYLKLIILVVVCTSLFFAFIYFAYYHDFCPCANCGNPIPVGCLTRFPEKYADKYVQVSGKYQSIKWEYNPNAENWTINSDNGSYVIRIYGTIYGPSAYFGNVPAHLSFSITNGTNISNLTKGKEYYWHGIFRFTDEVDKGNGAMSLKGMYLEVYDAEEV